jgi:hypothetical protein
VITITKAKPFNLAVGEKACVDRSQGFAQAHLVDDQCATDGRLSCSQDFICSILLPRKSCSILAFNSERMLNLLAELVRADSVVREDTIFPESGGRSVIK